MNYFLSFMQAKNISVHVFPVCTCVRSFHHCFHHCFHHLFHSSGDSSYHKSHLTDGGVYRLKTISLHECVFECFFSFGSVCMDTRGPKL